MRKTVLSGFHLAAWKHASPEDRQDVWVNAYDEPDGSVSYGSIKPTRGQSRSWAKEISKSLPNRVPIYRIRVIPKRAVLGVVL